MVLAAHSGAGASMVALALADATAATGEDTLLLDCAEPALSATALATDAELGDVGRWRLGRRGQVAVHRLLSGCGAVDALPAPDSVGVDPASHPGRWAVVDAGRPAAELIAGSGWLAHLVRSAQLVLVCRVSCPGVRAAEHFLAELPGDSLVVAVGPRVWPRVVVATVGPLLRAATEQRRLVTVPVDTGLAVTGVTSGPLPTPVASAGRDLAARLTHISPAVSGRRRHLTLRGKARP